jgi:hypothetical protein
MAATNTINDGWSKESEQILIEMWSERPCLFAISSPEYSNRDKKEKALREISDGMGKSGIYCQNY